MPLGISYYTLQALTYVIDVFRGKFKAEHNPFKVALFVMFFPQLQEGPFGRYDLLAPQFEEAKGITIDSLYAGIMRIIWGLFKIFMIANRASIISDAVFNSYKNYGSYTVILGGAAFMMQLYAEFSGYIDISQGVSNIFNIKLTENFDTPFISKTVAEFWRRWHISLGSFFRDYVFYPVSTSKIIRRATKGLSFNLSNNINLFVSLLIVWFLTGLWHGASWKYVFYGLYYFVIIIISTFLPRISKESKALDVFRIVRTFVLVLVGMIMFRAPDMNVFLCMMRSIFETKAPFDLFLHIDIHDFIILIVSVLAVVMSALFKLKGVDLNEELSSLKSYQKYLVCLAGVLVVVIFGAYGFAYMPPDPIYGGF